MGCCRWPIGIAPRLYTWLFQASAATLREVAADPRHLGAEIGVLSILHTWGQTLVRHPHVHCVVPAGGLSPDHQRWIHPKYAGFFLPVKVLSRVFRGKFVEALRRAYDRDELDLAGGSEHLRDPGAWRAFVDALFETDWVVYAKPAFGGRIGRPALSRALHPSGGDQQSPAARLRWRARDLLLQGLRPWRPAPHDDAHRHGVSPPLRPAHPAARLRAHPAVGIPREHLPDRSRGPRADRARHLRHRRHRPPTRRRRPPTDATTRATWACPRCGAAMIVGPILSALQLATLTWSFDTS